MHFQFFTLAHSGSYRTGSGGTVFLSLLGSCHVVHLYFTVNALHTFSQGLPVNQLFCALCSFKSKTVGTGQYFLFPLVPFEMGSKAYYTCPAIK